VSKLPEWKVDRLHHLLGQGMETSVISERLGVSKDRIKKYRQARSRMDMPSIKDLTTQDAGPERENHASISQ